MEAILKGPKDQPKLEVSSSFGVDTGSNKNEVVEVLVQHLPNLVAFRVPRQQVRAAIAPFLCLSMTFLFSFCIDNVTTEDPIDLVFWWRWIFCIHQSILEQFWE
mmetsp:Transcript_2543/g.5792  ORF Transcript_2543/g.5792 Transcript_2543/m.5792 type:complete len:104 (+) Transcript_2543:408-719(+)